jgi:hypothetical protein
MGWLQRALDGRAPEQEMRFKVCNFTLMPAASSCTPVLVLAILPLPTKQHVR